MTRYPLPPRKETRTQRDNRVGFLDERCWILDEVRAFGLYRRLGEPWIAVAQDCVKSCGSVPAVLTRWLNNEIQAAKPGSIDHEFPLWLIQRAADITTARDPRGRHLNWLIHNHLVDEAARLASAGSLARVPKRREVIDTYLECVVRTGLNDQAIERCGSLFEIVVHVALPMSARALLESKRLRAPFLRATGELRPQDYESEASRALLDELAMLREAGARPPAAGDRPPPRPQGL